MRLIRIQEDGQLGLETLYHNLPPYAILSHTWGKDEDEVSLDDVQQDKGQSKPGYEKLLFCVEQCDDERQYFWIDTCCINQTSATEVSEAINSMFRWYQEAAVCYVYLSDFAMRTPSKGLQASDFPAFRSCKWFRRGWTLQELLAPKRVEFYDSQRNHLGDRQSLAQWIQVATNISLEALMGQKPLHHFSVEERLRWAQHRETKREEDKVYSLLGIFDVSLVPIYGERHEKAYRRLLQEIEASGRYASAAKPSSRSTSESARDDLTWSVALEKWIQTKWDPAHQRCYRQAYDYDQGWIFHDWITEPDRAAAEPADRGRRASRATTPQGHARASDSPEAYLTHATSGISLPFDSSYRIRDPGFFQIGKVFAVLEPKTPGRVYHKMSSDLRVRRFIVAHLGRKQFYAFDLTTYDNQGTTKRGVVANEHAIVYSSGETPTLLPGESSRLRKSICIVMNKGERPLAVSRRINLVQFCSFSYETFVRDVGNARSRHLDRLVVYELDYLIKYAKQVNDYSDSWGAVQK